MSLIDSDALMSAVMAQDVVDKSVAKRLIIQAQTVDAVQVVRCNECRWYDKSTVSGTYEPIAYKCILHQRFTIGIQFCSDGERREEDDLPTSANHYRERWENDGND